MEQKIQILVIGCGGIGGVFAGHLATVSDVTLSVYSRNEAIVGAVQKNGLNVVYGSNRHHTPIAISASLPDDEFDFIFLATQPPQVEDAAESVKSRLKADGRVIVLQNGLCESRVAEHLGEKRVLGGIVSFGASTDGPGQIRRTSGGGVTLGSYAGHPDPTLPQLAEILDGLGDITVTSNLLGARFSKLALNCAVSGLGTLAGVRLGTLLSSTHARNVALEVMREAVSVSRAETIELERIGGTFDLNWLADPSASASGFSHWQRHAVLMIVGFKYRKLRSSMLSAIEKGRTPAVDYLNGEVAALGEKHGIDTPINAQVTQLIHAIASGRTTPTPQHLHDLKFTRAEIE